MCEFCGCAGRRTVTLSTALREPLEASDDNREAATDRNSKLRVSEAHDAERRLGGQTVATQGEGNVTSA